MICAGSLQRCNQSGLSWRYSRGLHLIDIDSRTFDDRSRRIVTKEVDVTERGVIGLPIIVEDTVEAAMEEN